MGVTSKIISKLVKKKLKPKPRPKPKGKKQSKTEKKEAEMRLKASTMGTKEYDKAAKENEAWWSSMTPRQKAEVEEVMSGRYKGGMVKKKKGYAAGGALQKTSASQKGLKKLPTSVRNKMGYMSKGGMASKKGKKLLG